MNAPRKPFICPECNKGFRKEIGLSDHRQVVHNVCAPRPAQAAGNRPKRRPDLNDIEPICIECGERGDLFHDNVPDEWIDRCFAVMALTPQHAHQVLTKRSARMREYVSRAGVTGNSSSYPGHAILAAMDGLSRAKWPDLHWPLPNVWLGVSVEDQTRADERIPDLLTTPAAVRWISAEPLLGPVDLNRIHETFDSGLGHSWESALNGKRFDQWGDGPDIEGCPKLDWVVVGGESGPGARPMHPDWARSLRDQCAAAGVPFLFKQWGSCLPGNMDGEDENGDPAYEIEDVAQPVDYDQLGRGKLVQSVGCEFIRFHHHRTGRLLDGVQHDGYPEVRAHG